MSIPPSPLAFVSSAPVPAFWLPIQTNRPRPGSQNGSATDQPCSQQQKRNPVTDLTSSGAFSFARRKHPTLAANPPQIKKVFGAVHKYSHWAHNNSCERFYDCHCVH